MSPTLEQGAIQPIFMDDPIESQNYLCTNAHLMNLPNQRNVSFRDIVTEITNVMNADKNITVFGVTLRHEKQVGKNTTGDSRNTVIGGVCVHNVNITAEELRRLMCVELPNIPALFSFLTKEGWPICRRQERLIKAEHLINEEGVICIQKEFEKQRFGVSQYEGESIGFIFADLNCSVEQLRDLIEQQLRLNISMKSDYRFIERNGWPVMLTQEPILSVMDIIVGWNIFVKGCDKFSLPIGISEDQPQKSSVNTCESEPLVRRRTFTGAFAARAEKHSFVRNNKGSEKWSKIFKGRIAKPILISYVRAEAADYALDLKKELVKMEYSVYLDVDEIKTGTDWQDNLNFAVTNCFLFVPLITPRYGKTKWTNKEIKLADVLGKIIVPVNFMDTWPPACLAIQFASTQYIPWKLPDSERAQSEITSDSRKWNPMHLKRVAKLVAECYKENYCKLPPSSKYAMVQPHVPRRLPSMKLKEENLSIPGQETIADENKQLIVISSHPCQKRLATDLKVLFEKDGHKVWCSTDIRDVQDNLCLEDETSTNPETPHDLPTIPEEEVFFGRIDTQTPLKMLNAIGDIKVSVTESGTYEHRSASRLPSDFSGIFNNDFSVTQENLDLLSTFQQKVDQAGVVIVLVSETYTNSVFSQQQVFYCEHRKRVVLIKCDNSVIPKWFRLLMGNDIIMRENNPQFECVLKSTVKRSLNPTTSETPKDATAEAKVNYLVSFLMRNLPLQDNCVYIAGSTKLQTQRAEEICRAIGRELAKMENVSIVTGGYYGASDVMAKTFCECREKSGQFPEEDSSVVHILPIHDSEDLSSRCRQNPDGSFEAVPYGKTVFLGDSVKERGTVVARLLDTCIVIEGGAAAVHEIEEFIWNDHFVIPIISTGGAAGGLYGVPVKIFERPPGVDKADWSILSNKGCTPEEVAKAVVNIMLGIKTSLTSNMIAKQTFSLSRTWKLSRKFSLKDNSKVSEGSDATSVNTASIERESHGSMRCHFERLCELQRSGSKKCSSKQRKWWKRIFSSPEVSE